MKKQKLKIYCTGCSAKIDVSDQVSFSQVNCPACQAVLTVPKLLGDISLLEKVSENRYFDTYRAIAEGRERSVKLIKIQDLNMLSNSEKFDIELRQSGGENIVLTPWAGEALKPLGNTAIEDVAKLFCRLCDSLQFYVDEGFFFDEIKPEHIYLFEDGIKLHDALTLQLLKSDRKASLSTTVREAGKVFSYLLFDHSEDYSSWMDKYIKTPFESNYFQFPWTVKGEKFEALRKLVRNMILKPDSFEDIGKIKKKLIKSAAPKTAKAGRNKKKAATLSIDKSDNKSKSAENAVNKINRSIRRSKKSNVSLALLLSFAAIAVLVIAVIAFKGSDGGKTSTADLAGSKKEDSQNSSIQEEELAKEQEQRSLEKLIKQEDMTHLDEAGRKKEVARLVEINRAKEAEKQADLKNFLAVINPPEKVKARFDALPAVSSSHLQSLMNKHCNDCHNSKKRKGDFVLDIFTKESSIFKDYEVIKHAYESVKLGDMPPDDEDISDEERQSVLNYFEKIIYTLESKQIDVESRALIRRLTPYEYDYTVKDITGLDLKLGESFPGDGGGNQGFANDAALMSVSPIQMEKFLKAAEIISDYSSFDLDSGFQFKKNERIISAAGYEKQLEAELYKNYSIYPQDFSISRYLPGLMKAALEVLYINKNANVKSAAAKLKVSPVLLERFMYYLTSKVKSSEEIKALQKWNRLKSLKFNKPDDHKAVVLKAVNSFAGLYMKAKIAFDNREETDRDSNQRILKNIEEIFHLNQNDAAKVLSGKDLINYNQTLEFLNFLRYGRGLAVSKDLYYRIEPKVNEFLKKVFRRPPDKSVLSSMTRDLLNDSLKFGMPLAARIFVIRAFSSFKFTFRIEEKNSRKIDEFDLASRLSYFLWAGPPDEELLTLAENGSLSKEDILTKQITRMLKDSRSDRLAKHFASQWLRFGDILEFDGPNEKVFKGFDKKLAKDMWQESAISFNYIVKNDRSLLEVFNADYTFVNKRLSDLYGLKQNSPSFKKVNITNGQRGGILGHASILTMTSFGQRTSPIVRGNWILSVLLGTPTPPPPMDVDPLPEEDVISDNFTLKQQLAKHRDNPACRGCHKKIDPLGIVLENYDIVGRWRTRYQKTEVDSESKIAGMDLKGPADLKKYLLKNKVQYIRNLSRKLLSYSLGRSIYYYDNYLINKMIENAIRNDYEFSSLVKTIVFSPQFQLK